MTLIRKSEISKDLFVELGTPSTPRLNSLYILIMLILDLPYTQCIIYEKQSNSHIRFYSIWQPRIYKIKLEVKKLKY